jgi:hypothetical protein
MGCTQFTKTNCLTCMSAVQGAVDSAACKRCYDTSCGSNDCNTSAKGNGRWERDESTSRQSRSDAKKMSSLYRELCREGQQKR